MGRPKQLRTNDLNDATSGQCRNQTWVGSGSVGQQSGHSSVCQARSLTHFFSSVMHVHSSNVYSCGSETDSLSSTQFHTAF